MLYIGILTCVFLGEFVHTDAFLLDGDEGREASLFLEKRDELFLTVVERFFLTVDFLQLLSISLSPGYRVVPILSLEEDKVGARPGFDLGSNPP